VAPLQLNVGGCILDLERRTVMQAPQSMLARIFSGRWDHVLPRDKSGRIFLDVDEKWIKPIFQHLYHLSLAHDSNEALETPESTFQDTDDLMGYYAALDFLGLVDTFYPDGLPSRITRYAMTTAAMPLAVIDPRQFIQKLQPVLTCDWRAQWKLLYKSSRDGLNLAAFQQRCINMVNTVVFIKEHGTGNVYGGYTAVGRTFPNPGVWITKNQDPSMFVFAVENSTMDAERAVYTKFELAAGQTNAWHDRHDLALYYGGGDLQSSLNGQVYGSFSYLDKGTWPRSTIAATSTFTADEVEVWQISDLSSNSDTSPIPLETVDDTDDIDIDIDNTASDICILETDQPEAIAFRDDMSALRAPVAQLSTELHTWLYNKLQQLEVQLQTIEVEGKEVNNEINFMTHHFPNNRDTDTTTTADNSPLRGIHDGIVHMILHGDKICTLQQTFQQFAGNKLANKYGSGRWNDAIEADLNVDGYIVEEFDYYCFRKLVNVMRLRAMMRSPYCKLPTDMKHKCPSLEPDTKRGALSWMLAHFMISKEDFSSAFAGTET
jgi:TLD